MKDEKQKDFEEQIVMILNEIRDKEITNIEALLKLENLIKNLLLSEKKEKLIQIFSVQIQQYFLDDDFLFKFYHKFVVNDLDPNIYINISAMINKKLVNRINELFTKYSKSTEREEKEKAKKLFYETLNNDNIKNSLKIRIVRTLFEQLSPKEFKEFLTLDKPKNTKKFKNLFYYYLDFLNDFKGYEKFLLLSLECSNYFLARAFIIQNINSDCMS